MPSPATFSTQNSDQASETQASGVSRREALVAGLSAFFFGELAFPRFSKAEEFVDRLELDPGIRIPDIALRDEQGNLRKLSDLEGKFVAIVIWGSWCGPCKKEFPLLRDTHREFSNARFDKGSAFEIFSIGFEGEDGLREDWVKALGVSKLPSKYHVFDADGSVVGRIFDPMLPQIILVDGERKIVAARLRGKALADVLNKHRIKPATE